MIAMYINIQNYTRKNVGYFMVYLGVQCSFCWRHLNKYCVIGAKAALFAVIIVKILHINSERNIIYNN